MIYCVEDDMNIRELMIYTLKSAGYEVKGFDSSLLFWENISKLKPELIILDVMLPDEDGITILKKLKASFETKDIPVIMATAKGSEYDKVLGLDTGADDYLVKTFGMMEMLSRVKAVLRRSKTKLDEDILEFKEIKLDKRKHTVFVKDGIITLTLKEYEILKLFMSNTGTVFSREQLFNQIWGIFTAFETRTIDVHIGTLRTKLGDAGRYIQTVRGVGYKMGDL